MQDNATRGGDASDRPATRNGEDGRREHCDEEPVDAPEKNIPEAAAGAIVEYSALHQRIDRGKNCRTNPGKRDEHPRLRPPLQLHAPLYCCPGEGAIGVAHPPQNRAARCRLATAGGAQVAADTDLEDLPAARGTMTHDSRTSPADPAVIDYYERAPEESRLEQGPFQLEQARTRELIERHAPPPPAEVLDVGGAAGAYALWLAERGYSVHLLDVVPRLVDEAARRSASASHPLVSCRVADARRLPSANESVKLVLLLGPLYHLVDREDRVAALREAARVLEPGGVVIAAGI